MAGVGGVTFSLAVSSVSRFCCRCRIFDERWRMSGRTPTTTPSAVAATMSGVSFARSTSTCAEHVGSQTFARWRHAAVQAGYRKGLNDLSEAQLQEGFDKGFATGFNQAVDAGRLLGVCRSPSAHSPTML